MASSSSSSSSSSHKKRSPVLTLFFVTLFLISAFLFIFIFRDRDTALISESDLLLLQTPPLSFPVHTPNETQTNQLIQQLEHEEPKIEPEPEPKPEPAIAIANPVPTDTKMSLNESGETQAESEGEEQKTEVGKPDENDRKSDSDDEVAAVKQQVDCDLYNGRWVKDEANYPIYEASSCPYVDEAYDCQANGRKDSDYTRWLWKPHACDLPRFNATDFLRRLQGKKVMLVGDSMNRNQFESFLCMLREGLQDKTKMYEVHGYKITKGRGYFVFKFEDYNCTVEFVRSHFLVREGVRVNGKGSSNPTLSIDRIDKTFRRWKKADILVFNTGHWWTHGKTARGVNYYKEGDQLYPKFDAVEAYRRAIKTWANWIDHNIDPKKQIVYYRGYSSAHFRGGDWDSGGSCNGETEPVFSGSILDYYPLKMKIVEEAIQGMKVPVTLLNVTRMTNFRKDGHPSVYGKNVTGLKKVSTKRQDCSHWCLPGVPDAWNELIYANLVLQQTNSRG